MSHLPKLIQDLTLILAVATAATFIFSRIRQPVVLGYIVAGFIVSPHTPGFFSVEDGPNIRVWAELGVIFFMFALGLEFSFRKLLKVGGSVVFAAVLEVMSMLFLGYFAAGLLGWEGINRLFVGCMIAISSTTIIIKGFDALGIKQQRFANIVLGMLIVEDLAAILILVGLSSFIKQGSFEGMALLIAAGKLLLVVGAWFIVGIFAIPRLVRALSRSGGDEMLTVASVALCLGLVEISAYFEYSVALGAFIMGSVLAESSEGKRIEHLIHPLRDMFGAVFFVSVGMLIEPAVVMENPGKVAALSAIVIFCKILVVSVSSVITGRNIRDSLRVAFSMAQIGEFSFIIGTLGITLSVMDPSIYPIIVAVSIVTTFTTPYLMRASLALADRLELFVPEKLLIALGDYASKVQKFGAESVHKQQLTSGIMRWVFNCVIVVTIALLSFRFLVPVAVEHLESRAGGSLAAWVATMVLCSPFIWGMKNAFRAAHMSSTQEERFGILTMSRMMSVLVIALASLWFIPLTLALVLGGALLVVFSYLFHRHLERIQKWFEGQLISGFEVAAQETRSRELYNRLAPWDAYLIELRVHPNCRLVGKRLIDLKLREEHSVNLVAIQRGALTLFNPTPDKLILPNDGLLVLGTDEQVNSFRAVAETAASVPPQHDTLSDFQLRQLPVHQDSEIVGRSIRNSGIRENYNGMVVGIERNMERVINPASDYVIDAGDWLWVVGRHQELERLNEMLHGSSTPVAA